MEPIAVTSCYAMGELDVFFPYSVSSQVTRSEVEGIKILDTD